MDKIFLDQLEVPCVIGIFEWERKIKQKILIDFEIPCDIRKAARTDKIKDTVDYKAIAKRTIQFVAASQFFLIEKLAEELASMTLKEFKLTEIKVRISKPGAVRGSKTVGIEIVRRAGKKKLR